MIFAADIELTVEDEDLGLALEGAAVSLRDGRQFVCDTDGKITFSLPEGRQVVVQISYPGYETKRLTVTGGAGPEKILVPLRLGGIMENRELVIEAQRPETSETKSGRSV
ncbi:MAG: carboxypeptidase-like regulatory domain-containing protein, partial [Treponema sp.]|nr:carboxypeptidase-like regulatory domain-containing protein [Treponema sp.]